MRKQRNDRLKTVTKMARLRAVLLASVAAGVMAATPMPAHALFGGISKAIGGLFGGGTGGSGGSACSGDKDGLFGSTLKLATGDIAGATTGASSAATAGLSGSGEGFKGCPVVESIPGAVEIQAVKTAVESVLQTREMIAQTKHQADMLAHGNLSIIDWLMDGWQDFLALLDSDDEAVGWKEPAVRDEFEAAYPENPVFETEEDLKNLREQQERLSRAASVDSKRISAKLAEDIEELSGKLEELETARVECAGQTCVADVDVQISMATAQLSAKTALMQAAHNRVVESSIDSEREARKAADATWDLMIRDVGKN